MGDARQPGGQRRARRVIAGIGDIGGKEGLLHHILGIFPIEQNRVGVFVHAIIIDFKHCLEVRLQKLCQLWHHTIMIKIPETLTGRDNIKAFFGKIDIFRRNGKIIYLHPGPVRKELCLFYLLRRYIRSRPLCTITVHISRQNTGTSSDIQHILTIYAKSSVYDFLVKLFWIDIPVLCIFL